MKTWEMFELTDEVALVTGGGSGLGKEMALTMAEAGAHVVIADINLDGAQQVAEEIKKLDRECLLLKTDVSKVEDVERMVRLSIEKWGRIDIGINSAGIGTDSPAEEMSKEMWDEMIAVNLTGVFLCAQAEGKEMIKRRKGSIINIASVFGLVASRIDTCAHYNAAKAGVVMLTKSLAIEWAKHNIRVNAIAPTFMKTPLLDDVIPEMLDLTPMQRVGEPEEIRGPALFLASQASSLFTGTVLVMDGGYSAW